MISDTTLWGGDHESIFKQDNQGSVTFVMNGSNQVVEKYSYDVFGRPKIMDAAGNERTGSAINNRFMFTGREGQRKGVRANY